MWTLNGLGETQVKLLDVCKPVLLHCSITGGKVVPANGRHMHGLYVVDMGKVRPAVANLGGDERDGSMITEFDLNGPTHLNMPGVLYLTGGDPSQTYQVRTNHCECYAFTPAWHALTTHVRDGSFTVPNYHSRIRTLGAPVGFTGAGLIGQLDHIPIPITGDDVLFFATPELTVITEWWG